MSDEWTDEPTIDRTALDLRDVLGHISQSIAWLSKVRDSHLHQPDLGLQAIKTQALLVAEYRALVFQVDIVKRIEQDEGSMSRLRGDIDQWKDGTP